MAYSEDTQELFTLTKIEMNKLFENWRLLELAYKKGLFPEAITSELLNNFRDFAFKANLSIELNATIHKQEDN